MDTFFHQFKQICKYIAMILSWTIFAILILIIGFLVYYLVCANIYATKGEKFEPDFSLYTIVSPSMEPNIKVYDVILNTKVNNPSEIKVGDVITFISTSNISNGMTVTHRVTAIVNGENGLEFKTKGDNNLSEDTDTAKANNILGKVILKIPQLGRLQFFLSSKGGWLIVIICPALFIIINDIFKIIKLNKVKKKINDVNSSQDNSEKINLEAFRKEEIKERLNKKEWKKAKSLEEKLKNNTLELPGLTENEEINKGIIDSPEEIKKVEDVNKNENKNTSKNKEIKKNIFGESLEEKNIFTDNKVENSENLENEQEEDKFIIELPKLK